MKIRRLFQAKKYDSHLLRFSLAKNMGHPMSIEHSNNGLLV